LNFFSGAEANRGHLKLDFREKQFKRDFNLYTQFLLRENRKFHSELKVGSESSAVLGMSHRALSTIQFPHNYIALQYAQYIIDIQKENDLITDE
jgi:hypothetical protein